VLDGDPAPPPQMGTAPQFSAHISCGQMAAWIKMSVGMELGLGSGDFVLHGDPASPPKKGGSEPPIFSPCLLWPNGWMDAVGTWHGGRPQPGDFVSDGDQPPLRQKGADSPPQFSAHFYCGQTAGCIKMPLDADVDLSAGNFVLDGDPAPSPKRGWSPQILGQCLLKPNGWMDQGATWHEGRPQPRRLC